MGPEVFIYNLTVNFAKQKFDKRDMIEPIPISEYTYHLPEGKIAAFPLAKRDQSKLLFYQQGLINHYHFFDLPRLLPSNSILFFNDTKVIPARLLFEKDTGAVIEIFLLNPADSNLPVQKAMQSTGKTVWKCTIGNLKRWPASNELKKKLSDGELTVTLLNRQENIVEFRWTPSHKTFAEIIGEFGATPLPPYIKRKANEDDKQRYQTVYSHFEGAVAAPTAGLHFTDSILKEIKKKGIIIDFLTLHVSAGTFQPVKTTNAKDHIMHSEQIIISRSVIENLLGKKKVIAVGTTAMRTLESLYWFGVKLIDNPKAEFVITQNDPYEKRLSLPSVTESMNALKALMVRNELDSLTGHTSIYLLPGYSFKVCKGLITNFHQPGSTLMLLVAAFVGPDWKKIYESALSNDYRFLSFGDSSLLLPA